MVHTCNYEHLKCTSEPIIDVSYKIQYNPNMSTIDLSLYRIHSVKHILVHAVGCLKHNAALLRNVHLTIEAR